MADKSYFAIGDSIGNIRAYKVEGQTFTLLATPNVMPIDTGPTLIYSIDFSPNADYMVAACNSSPRIYIYKRTGDTFTKLPNPANLPDGPASGGARFSPDGNFLAVAHVFGGSSFYQRSGDTFTRVANPIMGNGTSCTWNRDGSIVAASPFNEPPYLYSRTGTTFARIQFSSPALPTCANGMAFSPVSDLLVCAHNGAPFVSVSSITAGVHTRHEDPAEVPTFSAYAVAFNPAGNIVVVGSDSGLFIYTVSGTTLTRVSNPSGAPTTGIRNVAFNHDGTILTVGTISAPFLFTYSVSGTTLTQVDNPPNMLISNSIWGVSFSSLVSKIPNPSVITVDKSALIAMQNTVIYYNQNKPEGLTGGINFPNQTGWTTPANEPWSRLSIAPMVSTNVAVGGGANWVRRNMLIVVDVFTPKGSGVNTNLTICEEVINLFENTQFGNIKTFEANLAKIEDDPWLGYQVTINAYIEGC